VLRTRCFERGNPRRGRQTGVAFSLVSFFWRRKRKKLAAEQRQDRPKGRASGGVLLAGATLGGFDFKKSINVGLR